MKLENKNTQSSLTNHHQSVNENVEFITALGDWLTRKSVTPDSRYKLILKYISLKKETDPWGLGIDLLWALEHKILEEMEYIVWRCRDLLNDLDSYEYDECTERTAPVATSEIEFYKDEEVEYLKGIGALLVRSKTTRDDVDNALGKMPYKRLQLMIKMEELHEIVTTRLRELIRTLRERRLYQRGDGEKRNAIN